MENLIGLDIKIEDPRKIKTYSPKPPSLMPLENKSKVSYTKIEPIRNASKQKEKEKENDIEKGKNHRHDDTFIYPHSVHGVVIVKESETRTTKWGSGTRIALRVVLTAAHNAENIRLKTRSC